MSFFSKRVRTGAAWAAIGLPAFCSAGAGALNVAALPVHGVILGQPDPANVTVTLDDAASAGGAKTASYHLDGAHMMHRGMHFDALLEKNTLHDVMQSDGYTAGIPDGRTVSTIGVGDTLPDVHVVDQDGSVLNLSNAWLGKTVVMSFIFTRCPDALICPAISGKYTYLENHLDPARTHLVEITLDPKFDLPAVTHAYAARYAALPDQWSILTGEQNQIGFVISRFGLSNLENRPGNFEHDDTLAIIGPNGKISDIIPTGGWTPDDVIATVLHEQGDETNPLRRLELTAIAGVVSLCGGSATTGQVVLDSFVFVAGVLFFGGLLFLFARRIWQQESKE